MLVLRAVGVTCGGVVIGAEAEAAVAVTVAVVGLDVVLTCSLALHVSTGCNGIRASMPDRVEASMVSHRDPMGGAGKEEASLEPPMVTEQAQDNCAPKQQMWKHQARTAVETVKRLNKKFRLANVVPSRAVEVTG